MITGTVEDLWRPLPHIHFHLETRIITSCLPNGAQTRFHRAYWPFIVFRLSHINPVVTIGKRLVATSDEFASEAICRTEEREALMDMAEMFVKKVATFSAEQKERVRKKSLDQEGR